MLSEVPHLEAELRPQLLLWLARAAELAGDYGRAIACAGEALAMTEARVEVVWRSYAMRVYAFVAWRNGELDEAVKYARQCLHLSHEIDDRLSTSLALEMLAWINADQRRHQRAAVLLGVASTLLADVGSPITSYKHLVGFHNRCEQDIRTILGEKTFVDAFAHGRILTQDDAFMFASRTHQGRRQPSTLLTRREHEVADLLAEGLSNKEIAARLVISQRTAETHVENILTKLGFSSRGQVAAWVMGGLSP